MVKYILKRLVQLIPIVFGITFLSFGMMHLAGGDAVTYMYENAGAVVSQDIIDAQKAEYGLDKPFIVQYGKWLSGMVTGDMGKSYVSKRDVYDTFARQTSENNNSYCSVSFNYIVGFNTFGYICGSKTEQMD